MRKQKPNKEKIDSLLTYLDDLSNKYKADIYKQKYLKTKRTLDAVAKHLGL
jgi:hypothetical protein